MGFGWFGVFLYWGTRASNQHFSRPRVSVNAADKSGEKLGREKPAQGLRIARGCPSAGGVRPEASGVSGREGCVRQGWGTLSRWFPCARLTQGATGSAGLGGAAQGSAVPTPKTQAIVKAKGAKNLS